MVIDGRPQRQTTTDVFTFVEFEGERIRLPQPFVEAAGLTGKDRLERSLFVIRPGAYRLLPAIEELSNEVLQRIHSRWEEAGSGEDPLERTDSPKWAGVRASLIPCVVSPPGPGWRINVPKVARQLVPGDRSGVFLLIVGGCVELWFPDVMRQAVSVPVTERFE
jgi:hypothetical protein